MAKYINREDLVAWLKRIPLKDLSDGLGLCRVIMEEDFKRAIRTIPEGAIVDLTQVVHCRECEYAKNAKWNKKGYRICPASHMEITDDDFCSYGVREDGHGHG
nr:MAG TPA: hypothetical protein [Caudoviricetes sp.]